MCPEVMKIHPVLTVILLGAFTYAQDGYYQEEFRLQYHFSPEINWMNDPNGMVYFDGLYHLYYQHNPFGINWGNMSWGHAVSTDLVHWEHQPVAIPYDDPMGVFSGTCVVDVDNTSGFGIDGEPPLVAAYTGWHSQTLIQDQRMAYSVDSGFSYTQYEGNPVIDLQSTEFRDPYVFWHEPSQYWVMVVALAMDRKIRFDKSTDLRNWEFMSEFGPAGSIDGVWECPNLVQLPVENSEDGLRKWVFIVSVGGEVTEEQYFVGEFDGVTFIPDELTNEPLWVDAARDFYASNVWSSVAPGDTRTIWLGWFISLVYAAIQPTDPWRGSDTIPREIFLRETPDGSLCLGQRPVEELESLRGRSFSFNSLTTDELQRLIAASNTRGNTLEIVLEFEPEVTVEEFGVSVLGNGQYETRIGYTSIDGSVYLDRSNSGDPVMTTEYFSTPVALQDNLLELHIFVDWSSVEVFADNGCATFSVRVYPPQGSDLISVYSTAGETRVTGTIYELESIWN